MVTPAKVARSGSYGPAESTCYMEVAVNTSYRFFARFRMITCTGLLGMTLVVAGCADTMVNTPVSRNIGIKQYDAGQYATAAGTFRTTLRSNPADYGSSYFLGACMAKMGSYEQAIL